MRWSSVVFFKCLARAGHRLVESRTDAALSFSGSRFICEPAGGFTSSSSCVTIIATQPGMLATMSAR